VEEIQTRQGKGGQLIAQARQLERREPDGAERAIVTLRGGSGNGSISDALKAIGVKKEKEKTLVPLLDSVGAAVQRTTLRGDAELAKVDVVERNDPGRKGAQQRSDPRRPLAPDR